MTLVFKADENQTPNIYTREIYIKEAFKEKIIHILIEVDSAKPAFDIDISISLN